jgi:diguanylate cyclase (GGDEF)-like protein/PAS domain S-box-containing protein
MADITYGRRKTDIPGLAKEPAAGVLYLSEPDFVQLFESAIDGILLISPKTGEVAYVNQAFIDMSGYSRDEIRGKKLWDVGPLAAIDVGLIVFRELHSQESVYYDGLPLEAKSGGRITVELFCSIHVVRGKKVIQCTFRNITERKRIEEELQRAEARFRTLFKNAGVGMMIEGGDERIIESNRTMEELSGYSDEELHGMPLSDVVYSDDRPTEEALYQELLQGKRDTYQIEERLTKKDGAQVRVLMNVSLIRDMWERPQYVIRIVEDLTARRHAEEALSRSEEQFRLLFEHNPYPMWIYDSVSLAFLAVNDAALSFYGYPREEFLGMTIQDILVPEDVQDFLKTAHTCQLPYSKPDGCWKHRKKNGEIIDVESAVHEMQFNNRNARFVFAMDVTARKRADQLLKETERFLHEVLNALPVGVWLSDSKGNIFMGNPAGKRIWGGEKYVGPEQYGEFKGWWADSGKRIRPEEWALARAVAKGETSLDEVIHIDSFDGAARTILNSAIPLRDADGRTKGVLVVSQDITERQHAEEELKRAHVLLERQATIDSLTGIFNRPKFNEVFGREIQEALRYKQPLSLIMFDIDHFKSINDTYGHLTGDAVLKELARLVSANIRTVDIFARWGGEEFMILSPNNELKSAQQLTEKIRMQIEKNDFSCPCRMTCSFGLTQFREQDTADDFIKRADDALYRAKGRGRNSVEAG